MEFVNTIINHLTQSGIRELKDGGAPVDVANGQALCGSCHTRKTSASRAARQKG